MRVCAVGARAWLVTDRGEAPTAPTSTKRRTGDQRRCVAADRPSRIYCSWIAVIIEVSVALLSVKLT